MLAKQHPKTALRTALGTVYGMMIHKAMVSGKEQICVGTGQAR
jgi:hypothetical protein